MTLVSLAEPITGFWENPILYKMFCPRTQNSSFIIIPGADDPEIMDADERDEYVRDGMDAFREAQFAKGTHQSMDKKTQNEFGSHLGDIKKSNRKRIESGNPKYFPGNNTIPIKGVSD